MSRATIGPSVLRASLGAHGECAEPLAELLERAGIFEDRLEASVRRHEGVLSGQRMMLEGLDGLTALAVLSVLGFDLSGSKLLAAIRLGEGFPVIGGWDASGEALVGKLYVNLSDAAKSRRAQVARALDLQGAPHVIGYNLRAHGVAPHPDEPEATHQDGLETKVYEQWAEIPDHAPDSLRRFVGARTPAGVVRSSTVHDEGLRTKAWFVAPRTVDAAELLRGLEGYEEAKRAFPFAPGVIKSVGLCDAGWTVYAKAKSAEGALWSLEPTKVFACPRGELGLFVVPNEQAARAYCRTEAHALSYRVRSGQPKVEHIDALMAWAEACVRRGEQRGTTEFGAPPEPWRDA